MNKRKNISNLQPSMAQLLLVREICKESDGEGRSLPSVSVAEVE